MREFKGTKGEWKIVEKGNTVKSLSILSEGVDKICHGISPKGGIHNAKLIAAAPELLELALLVNGSFGGGNVITFSERDIEQFQQVINKALGQ